MILPSGEKKLLELAKGLIEECTASQATRTAAYKTYGQWIETGRANGGLATANLLYGHTDRVATHLYSPIELRFSISADTVQPKGVLDQFEATEKLLTRCWNDSNIDVRFGDGVLEGLRCGASILKQLVRQRWDSQEKGFVFDGVTSRLVFPWNFGVYNESINSLDEQEAMCETIALNKHQVWRRIQHLPDAKNLYKKIISSTSTDDGTITNSFVHQILSTAVLDTSLSRTGTVPGGVVELTSGDDAPTLSPEVPAELYPMHELVVWNDEQDDWTTIQVINKEVLVAPRMKRTNLFCPGANQYTLIQPNTVNGYFWGRSEIVDLMMLQQLLATSLDDSARLMGLQIDKILGFTGDSAMDDERYDQFRQSGFANLGPGSDIKDLTPKFPPELLPFIKQIIELMDLVSGFTGILSGQGEPGVRAGVHADTLVRTGSPRLRDRSLLVERQVAQAADTTLQVLQKKDGRQYWTDAQQQEETAFLLEELPEERQVSVDSHSTSPVFMADHANMIFAGLKSGLVDRVSAIEMLPFENKDLLISRLKEGEANQQQMFQALAAKDPQEALKVLAGGKK